MYNHIMSYAFSRDPPKCLHTRHSTPFHRQDIKEHYYRTHKLKKLFAAYVVFKCILSEHFWFLSVLVELKLLADAVWAGRQAVVG